MDLRQKLKSTFLIRFLAAIVDMLKPQSTGSSKLGQMALWKVLIIDDFTQQILSTLLKVNELRELGVTVHLYWLC